jgi:hypothetical protein
MPPAGDGAATGDAPEDVVWRKKANRLEILDLSGLDWNGFIWTGLNLSGLEWIYLDWTEFIWTGMDLSGLN